MTVANSLLATPLTRALRISFPIIQAPCAGHTTPELVASVSNAGGLGSLGAAMMSPDAMREAVRTIKQKTKQPFAVNLFAREPPPTSAELQGEYPKVDQVLDVIRGELNLPKPSSYTMRSPPLENQITVILEERVPVVSFTFGLLPKDDVDRLRNAGVYLIGTATTVEEALTIAGLNSTASESSRKEADAIVAQGIEAGGHRGAFLKGSMEKQLPTEQLLKEIRAAFAARGSSDIPLIAAGGLSNGNDAARALFDWKADAVCLGTLFMLSAESSTPDVYRHVLLESPKSTRLTRGLSGRFARGYPNEFMVRMDQVTAHVPSYDIHSARTKDIVAYANQNKDSNFMMLWSGTNSKEAGKYSENGTLPSAEIMQKLVTDIEAFAAANH